MKNVLITGASRGLGLALAEEYAKSGFFVLACSRGGMTGSLKALQEKYAGHIGVFKMDVADGASVNEAAAQIKAAVPGLDLIINNAGLQAADCGAALEEVDIENCLEVYSVNTLGPLRVTQAFLGLLEGGGMKNIVNITSEAGSISNNKRDREFDYAMSKAALNMQTSMLNLYLGKRGVRVLGIHPGWFRSDMGGSGADFSPAEAAQNVKKIADKFGGDPCGPVYVDYNGETIPY
jgi:NAD(P)-dependent dehydrogenase (short-subunit alcohol dehydrogenase family)